MKFHQIEGVGLIIAGVFILVVGVAVNAGNHSWVWTAADIIGGVWVVIYGHSVYVQS